MRKRRKHSAIRLSVEGLLTALVVGAWLWVVVCLGAQAMVAQTSPSGGEDFPGGYMLACPGAQGHKEGIGSAGADEAGCLREVRLHATTSRHPGSGLAEQAHRKDT